MPQFYTLPTAIGEAKLANAIALGGTIEISELAIGDGGGSLPTPDSDRESLVNQVRRAAINTSVVDEDNPNWIVVEQVLPPDVGGWTIREIGLYDADGDMIAYGNYPETYKPVLSEGSGRTQTIRFVMQVSDTAAVTLKVDPSVVLATREYVDDAIDEHAQSRNHPDATTSAKGMMQFATLPEHLAGERADRAAKPSGVQVMIDKAVAAGAYQFAAYDPERTYSTGETVRGSDGVFYEFYDRDGDETVKDVDPTNSDNRPHIWMVWDGVRPGTVIEWRSETLPEGYLENDGWQSAPRQDYRRIFAANGTTHGEGDGSTTFGMPNDNDGDFKRGWNASIERGLNEHQSDAVQDHAHGLPTSTGSGGESKEQSIVSMFSDSMFKDGLIEDSSVIGDNLNIQSSQELRTYRLSSFEYETWAPRTSDETRPRNNAVIWLTKI
ncbi:phage tail protein [Chromohalobacter sp. 296-RDG]|uniref:phage tail-collar fiber domain-containing protein n=1 Tax=Chromohalobacter sp. 296-RDG TaxID=2994062 RepID=UPI002469A9C1|nr:phage tail protein [Chromohalobacter sp. 296-RDG]